MKELAFKRPEPQENRQSQQTPDIQMKMDYLIQFLIEKGVIDPLDWKAYLVEKKKAA
ncbi:MAG: hypothetical protein HYS98_08915 [Deltaproteobacteria bacterium]|nr:hypothetical protein [Deltaproteobacteria bacterium]